VHTPPLAPGAPSRARYSARTPRPDQPPTRASPRSSPASHRGHGADASSPSSWASSPATCTPSSANGPSSASSPAPATAPTHSTRRASHPRQPPTGLNFAALTACGLALTRRIRPRQSSSEEDARRLNSLRQEARMPYVALPEKRKVGSSTLPLTTSFALICSALTSADSDWGFHACNRRVTMTARA
jgi:hypothetical protein